MGKKARCSSMTVREAGLSNSERACRAAAVVWNYSEAEKHVPPEPLSDCLVDLLADLRHYCDTFPGLDFEQLNGQAQEHYQAELLT